jgi:hypothetical protein
MNIIGGVGNVSRSFFLHPDNKQKYKQRKRYPCEDSAKVKKRGCVIYTMHEKELSSTRIAEGLWRTHNGLPGVNGKEQSSSSRHTG